MTKKIYKTANGKDIDMGALMLQNESVRAVGNMGVNAKGDIVDSSNKIIEKSTKRISKQYAKQVTTTTQDVTASKPRTSKVVQPEITHQTQAVEETAKEVVVAEKELGGLAAAIAKARAASKI